jgi:hypothetical protein
MGRRKQIPKSNLFSCANSVKKIFLDMNYTFNDRTKPSYVLLIPIMVYLFKAVETIILEIESSYNIKINFASSQFASGFIEWFGVLYGILLPLILVRAWEQLDDIDREFDREADTVKILYSDLSFLRLNKSKHIETIFRLLQEYVVHVINNYRYEVKDPIKENKLYSGSKKSPKVQGDEILENVRWEIKILLHSNILKAKEVEVLIPELIGKLNDIVDIRGDRIAYASQRLFESLRVVVLITSIVFVLPFYFVGFSAQSTYLDNILVTSVTFLVIFIYILIEDFDEPFGGTWKISDDSWKSILYDMVSSTKSEFNGR